jgi:hypothetical protein
MAEISPNYRKVEIDVYTCKFEVDLWSFFRELDQERVPLEGVSAAAMSLYSFNEGGLFQVGE